eukprot:scaffold23698_cov44-Prasinocladus_malaysianus.AAC.1
MLALISRYDHQRTAAEQAEHERRCAAAAVIQRKFRQGRWSSLLGAKTQTEAQLHDARRAAQALAEHGELLEAQRVAGQALTGRQLVSQTFVVAQKTMDDMLAAFLIPSRDLEKYNKFNRTKERITGAGGLSPSPGVLPMPGRSSLPSPANFSLATPRDSNTSTCSSPPFSLDRRPSVAGSTSSSVAPSTAVSLSEYNLSNITTPR